MSAQQTTSKRHSMTGFATRAGAHDGLTWVWDMRAVNGKGLDVRMRMPDWIAGLEEAVRKKVTAAVARGNVTVNLRLTRDGGTDAVQINESALAQVLDALAVIEQTAMDRNVTTVAPSTVEVMVQRGVLDTSGQVADTGALLAVLVADLDPLIRAFNDSRGAEGARMGVVVSEQVDDIERMVAAATALQDSRRADIDARFKAALARVVQNADGLDPERVAAEIAMIAVKADVTEELDRLRAHVAAARDLLAKDGPVGRKLDFLSQEFNREANTLCAKAQHAELTAIGLDLKLVIDQMREQIQNVE